MTTTAAATADPDTLANDDDRTGELRLVRGEIPRDVFARRRFRREYRSTLAKIPIVTRQRDSRLSLFLARSLSLSHFLGEELLSLMSKLGRDSLLKTHEVI